MQYEKYYFPATNTIRTWMELQEAQIGTDNTDFLRERFNGYPLEVKRHPFNDLTHEAMADALPVLSENGMSYTLHYRPRPLNADVVRANLARALREERDRRIAATDYLMAADYPLAEGLRAGWAAYRQALRDMPMLAGFPWNGGGEDDTACPWPVKPA